VRGGKLAKIFALLKVIDFTKQIKRSANIKSKCNEHGENKFIV
jgi:hypothetical protein